MEFDFILACGDSFTEGCQDQIGKGVEGTWPGMLAERFGVPCANIARGGSSNTTIALQPVNTPHDDHWKGLGSATKPLIIFGFTVMDRWTYFHPDLGLIHSHYSIDPQYLSKEYGNMWTDLQKHVPIKSLGRTYNIYGGQPIDNYVWATVQAIKMAMQYETLIPGATVLWGFIHERYGPEAFLENIKVIGDNTVLEDGKPVVSIKNMEWPSMYQCFNKFTSWEPLQRQFYHKREYWLTATDGHPNLEGIKIIADIMEKGIREQLDEI